MNNRIKKNLLINMRIVTILFCLVLSSCNNASSNNSYDVSSIKKKKIDTLIQKNNNFYSGKYGDISIAIDQQFVTGVYEYYDNWNEKDKEFMDINVFYFFGKFTNDSTVVINTLWPNTQQSLKGAIVFSKTDSTSKLSVKLSDQPLGYNDVNFTQEHGVEMNLAQKSKWLQIRFVKIKKAKTYDKPDDVSVRKSYLVENDIVKVLQISPTGFIQVEYSNLSTSDKHPSYWIKEVDLNGILH